MIPERWQHIKTLLKAALEHDPAERAGFLDEACGSDAAIRREVESLLEVEEESFLERPALPPLENEPEPSSFLSSNAPPEIIGRHVSHYEVLDEISRGGMGIVYRARDVKLDRDVALKVLPLEWVSRLERKRRFVQEAKAAAAMSHPRIATVHEIDEADGVTFIAMELIRGDKLSTLLEQARLPVSRAIELALEITEGIAYAHDSGIVHRDLKPSNIMIADDGHAKIIDFGVAKLVEPMGPETNAAVGRVRERGISSAEASRRARAPARSRTDTGQLLGTLSYMSPEQARAQNVDHRSDLFTFGILLYEMLTGEHPFTTPGESKIPEAILDTPAPRLPSLGTGVFDERAQAILDKCLKKSPDERYQSAKELLSDLQRLKEAANAGPLIFATKGWPEASVPLLVLALLAGAALYLLRPREEPTSVEDELHLSNPLQITSAVGVENRPAWAPDGRVLAYQSTQAGSPDIWVIEIGSGNPLNRTANHAGADLHPSWSPDGSEIAFWSDREGEGFFVMPAFVGAPHKVASAERLGAAHWSPDGTKLTYVASDATGVFFETISLESRKTERSPAPGQAVRRVFPVWSPDGRFVTYMDAPYANSAVHPLVLLRLADGQAFSVTDGQTRIFDATFSPDGRSLYFISNQGGSQDLWHQPLNENGEPDGEHRRITTGMGIRSAALSLDGTKLAYSKGRRIANLWKVPILDDRPATWTDAQQLTFDQALIVFVSVSADRRRLAFSSDRNGNQDLWTMPVEGGEMALLAAHPSEDFSPVGSPDGKQVAFYSNRSGNRDIWVLPLEGGPARQLTQSPAADYHPDWSPDGRQLAFVSTRSGNRAIWVMPAEGGEARQVIADPHMDLFPKWSPDGTSLLFHSSRGGRWHLWRVAAARGEPATVTEGPALYPRWSIDGSSGYFTGIREKGGDLWRTPLDGDEPHRMTALSGKPGSIGGLALATDGKSLFFTWEEDLGDLWVMDATGIGQEN